MKLFFNKIIILLVCTTPPFLLYCVSGKGKFLESKNIQSQITENSNNPITVKIYNNTEGDIIVNITSSDNESIGLHGVLVPSLKEVIVTIPVLGFLVTGGADSLAVKINTYNIIVYPNAAEPVKAPLGAQFKSPNLSNKYAVTLSSRTTSNGIEYTLSRNSVSQATSPLKNASRGPKGRG